MKKNRPTFSRPFSFLQQSKRHNFNEGEWIGAPAKVRALE